MTLSELTIRIRQEQPGLKTRVIRQYLYAAVERNLEAIIPELCRYQHYDDQKRRCHR